MSPRSPGTASDKPTRTESEPDGGTRIERLFVHPLKSAAGQSVSRWPLGPLGLVGDRELMLVDEDGTFVTLRGTPRVVTITPAPFEPDSETLVFTAPSHPPLEVSRFRSQAVGHASTRRVQIWGEWVEARAVSAEADAWFSSILGKRVRLVQVDPGSPRGVDPRFASATDRVGFADGFPLLVVGTASLEALERELGSSCPVERFRPNLVIRTGEAWVEDRWRRIRVGAIDIELVKPCARCVGINVEPVTGKTGREPLRTLARSRTRDGQVFFGHNAIHRGVGWLAVGDPVEVLEQVTPPTEVSRDLPTP